MNCPCGRWHSSDRIPRHSYILLDVLPRVEAWLEDRQQVTSKEIREAFGLNYADAAWIIRVLRKKGKLKSGRALSPDFLDMRRKIYEVIR